MAQTYWNPGSLFDITELRNASEVQCVGKAKHGGRCGWRMRDGAASPIVSALARLAAKPPTQVTEEEIQGLARLCLCGDWHYSQWKVVSERWKPALALAARRYQPPQTQIGVPNSPPTAAPLFGVATIQYNQQSTNDDEMKRLRLDRKRCLELLGVTTGIESADLVGNLAAYHFSNGIAKRENEAALIRLQSSLSEAQLSCSSLQQQLGASEEKLARAKLEQSNAAEAHRAEVLRLHESRKSETGRLIQVQKQFEAAKTERETLETRLTELQGLFEAAKTERQSLEARISALKEDLERTDRVLDEETALTSSMADLNEDLKSQLLDAEERISALQEDLGKANLSLDEETAKAKTLEESNTNLASQLSTTESRISTLQEDLQKANFFLDEETTKTKTLEESNTDLASQLSAALSQEKHSAAQADEADRNNKALLKEHAAAQDEISRLQADLSAAKDETSRLENDRSVMARALQQFQAEIQTIQQTNEHLTQENSVLQERVAAQEMAGSKGWRYRLRAWMSRKPLPMF